MRTIRALIQVVALLGLMAVSAGAAPIIRVYTALAPNAYGSPSFSTWTGNAVTALQGGTTVAGTAGTPGYFETRSVVTSAEAIVTGFPSWLGQSNPGSAFGPAFANELGNRMHFPVWIDGNGDLFSISQLGFQGNSTDPGNYLDWAFGPGGYNYSTGWVGLQYGADGQRGGGDDVLVTAGANTQLVNELFGRGSGNSFAAYCDASYPPPSGILPCTVLDQQAQIDSAASYPGAPFTLTGTYYLTEQTGRRIAEGSGTFEVRPVPEPTTLLLLGLGLAAAGRKLRRR